MINRAAIFPGRKIEAKPGNIKIGETSKTRSSLIPLQIVGIDKNVLVDKSGVFLGDRIFEKVLIERQIPPGFSAQGTAAPTDPATDAPLAVAEAVKEAHISKRFHRRVHKVQR